MICQKMGFWDIGVLRDERVPRDGKTLEEWCVGRWLRHQVIVGSLRWWEMIVGT